MEYDSLSAPQNIVDWLSTHGYNPRSPRHGAVLLEYFVDDLRTTSSPLNKAFEKGDLVVKTDYTIGNGVLEWTIDLVIGPPSTDTTLLDEVWLAIDAKSIMTAHGKNRKNRQRDIGQMSSQIHRFHDDAIVGAIVLVNSSETFNNPHQDGVKTHNNIDETVETTLDMFEFYTDSELENPPDSISCIVVNQPNQDNNSASIDTDLSPDTTEPTHYGSFVQNMANSLEEKRTTKQKPTKPV